MYPSTQKVVFLHLTSHQPCTPTIPQTLHLQGIHVLQGVQWQYQLYSCTFVCLVFYKIPGEKNGKTTKRSLVNGQWSMVTTTRSPKGLKGHCSLRVKANMLASKLLQNGNDKIDYKFYTNISPLPESGHSLLSNKELMLKFY